MMEVISQDKWTRKIDARWIHVHLNNAAFELYYISFIDTFFLSYYKSLHPYEKLLYEKIVLWKFHECKFHFHVWKWNFNSQKWKISMSENENLAHMVSWVKTLCMKFCIAKLPMNMSMANKSCHCHAWKYHFNTWEYRFHEWNYEIFMHDFLFIHETFCTGSRLQIYGCMNKLRIMVYKCWIVQL